MSFNEAEKQKFVILADIEPENVSISEIAVPRFQRLESVKGDLEAILATISRFKGEEEPIWLEVLYDAIELVPQLQHTLNEAVSDSPIEILRIVNKRLSARVLEKAAPRETLDSLTEEAVFRRCLEQHHIESEQADELLMLFGETLQAIADDDLQAD